MHIVGTAGHVDHGKSSLVAALTGVNPDRWLEERERGMTLDLGFAPLHLVGADAGIVDVPGHERFLHNMLAGASGIDLLLLVVAANEGAMPQTHEHLEILQFLNVRSTIVAISKIDAVSPERRDEAERAILESLAPTMAARAPVVRVSSATGEGLEALRAAISAALHALPPRDARAPAYLPVDRVFALPGLGTIVTGTLMQGAIAVGDAPMLQPRGEPVRVRSLQTFGRTQQRVDAGSRVALNLAGVDVASVRRGDVIAGAELPARSSAEVRFSALPAALPLLRRRTPVRAYVGSAEILGTLVFRTVPVDTQPVPADLHLRTPAVLFPGVRFVVRRPSPKTLLGGGVVSGLEAVESADDTLSTLDEIVLAVLLGRGLDPADVATVAFTANVREDVAAESLARLVEREDALRVGRPEGYLDGKTARALLDRIVGLIGAAHAAEPWALGLTSIAIARALGMAEAPFVRIAAEFVEQGRLVNRNGYYSLADHQPKLSAEQKAFFEELVPVETGQPFLPVPFAEALSAVKRSRIPGAARAFDALIARGALVKAGDFLYRGSQIAQIVARVEEFLRRNGTMTAAQFRDLLGTSRKYGMPLLEWLDARGVTLRSGDNRVLRKKHA